jgi:PTH2 family peptidyl-tRNA hydrolase
MVTNIMEKTTTTTIKQQKLVIVIRKDLGMSLGKIISQAVHASHRGGNILKYVDNEYNENQKFSDPPTDRPEPKCIVCYVNREKDLLGLIEKAKEIGVPYGLQKDAGSNEVPKGTMTALAIGPDDEDKVSFVTKRLQTFDGTIVEKVKNNGV